MSNIQVDIFDVDQDTGTETFRCRAPLRECFPDPEDEEYHKAANYIDDCGRYWAGGGAAPLVRLVRART